MMNFPKWKIGLITFICLWSIWQSVPNFLNEQQRESFSSFISDHKMNLGLDLQGGSYLLLKVGFEDFLKGQQDLILDDVRNEFRKERIGYKDLSVRKNDDASGLTSIYFSLRNVEDADKAKDILKKVSRDFDVRVENESQFFIGYTEESLKNIKHGVLEKSIEIVRRRVDETGTREPSIQRQGDDRILLQVPGLQDPEGLKQLLGKTAKMTFHLMDSEDPFAQNTDRAKPGMMLLDDVDFKSPQKYLVHKQVALSGELLVDSQPSYDGGSPVVSFRFNNQGAKKFAEITAENIGKPFAVVLDGKVITAPRINTAILGGSGIITGNFTVKEATDLSLLLRSGALPAPLEVIEERSVGPSLGSDSIEAGKVAGAIGFALVAAVMIVFYGIFGLFAIIALIFNMLLIFAPLSLVGATLTLPGIAGLILTMGMSVDANVLIFERIKDEIKLGKSAFASIESGFKLAFGTIMDSNVTSLIATFLLFSFGTGPVKGFAVTLTVGILASMFSAIMLTKFMVLKWYSIKRPKTLPL
jgi:preprotein translocase subunit SecD